MANNMTLPEFKSRYTGWQHIGSGGFATVYRALDEETGRYIALKKADVQPEFNHFTLQREVELVNKMPLHPNIARYDACYRFPGDLAGEVDVAVLKYYEYGNLEKFLTEQNLTEPEKRTVIKGILQGVAFLHQNRCIHRDLKAQNILIHREDGIWVPKIADFGLSRETTNDQSILNSSIGISFEYAAPEQIQNRNIQKTVDLWALGVIIYRIIAGELPFQSSESAQGRSNRGAQLELSKKIVNT